MSILMGLLHARPNGRVMTILGFWERAADLVRRSLISIQAISLSSILAYIQQHQ
jgi:hypothetical protein